MSQHHQGFPVAAGVASAGSFATAARLRARRVEEVAARADLQGELRALVGRVQGLLAGRTVLEIACGTGWWTHHLTHAAAAVVGLDDDADLVHLAACRPTQGRARFVAADLTAVDRVGDHCDAGFAAFLASALHDDAMTAVFASLHRRLGPGARMVLVDEREAVAGGEAALRRRLRDLAPDAQGVKLDVGSYFWCLSYTL